MRLNKTAFISLISTKLTSTQYSLWTSPAPNSIKGDILY